jgi:hypothetical protein
MDGEDRIAAVVRPGQCELEFELGELLGKAWQARHDLGQNLLVLVASGQIEELGSVVELLLQRNPGRDLGPEVGELFQQSLRRGLIIPEIGVGRPLV